MGQVSRDAIVTSRHRSRRTNAQEDQDAFDEHARQIGEVIYLWNRLHGALFLTFWAITDSRDYDFAYGIWHSIQSDSTQRQMVEKAAGTGRIGARMKSNVLWICRAHEKLAPYRNAFAHVGFYYHSKEEGFAPEDLGARKAPLELLASYPKTTLFRRLRGDLAALADYAEGIGYRILYRHPTGPQISSGSPWTERPRLQLVPTTPPSRSKVLRQKKSAAKQRQREASRP
ncbi:MAG: hypothetical protein RDV41_13445 [Planctomycetota bacterium]|nr:hypothetical protein [Planctomycetota bacterium]